MDLWQEFDLHLDADDILRGQGMDPAIIRDRRPALVASAERALTEGMAAIHPGALVREFAVVAQRHERLLLEGGGRLSGPLISHHLSGARRVAAVLCTLGEDLETAAAQAMDKNPLLGLALDGLGNAAVERIGQQVCSRIGDRAAQAGLQTSTPLSPGAPDWPVEIGQPQIFALVEADQAGIQITSGGMMIPKKSISFVTGIGSGMDQTEPCDVCNLKEVCRYRNG
jgi:hypothetical protein